MSSDFTRSQYQLMNALVMHANKHEIPLTYPYLDTRDKITTGAGYNISDHGGQERFTEMPWRTKVDIHSVSQRRMKNGKVSKIFIK